MSLSFFHKERKTIKLILCLLYGHISSLYCAAKYSSEMLLKSKLFYYVHRSCMFDKSTCRMGGSHSSVHSVANVLQFDDWQFFIRNYCVVSTCVHKSHCLYARVRWLTIDNYHTEKKKMMTKFHPRILFCLLLHSIIWINLPQCPLFNWVCNSGRITHPLFIQNKRSEAYKSF